MKLKSGFEAAQFSVRDADGFASRRYLLIKNPEKGLLALSVRIPGNDAEKQWTKHFARMTSTAKFK